MLMELIIVLICVCATVFLFFQKLYNFWEKKGIFTLPPKCPLGNAQIFLPKGLAPGIINNNFYDDLKHRDLKFGGIFYGLEPYLVIINPELIKDVLITNFDHFINRGVYCNKFSDPLSANLFALNLSEWKLLRNQLTPTYTSGKIKMMFHLVSECAQNINSELDRLIDTDVDIKDVFCKFAIDVIGSCAFGIDCNSFENPEAEFRQMGKKIFSCGFWESWKTTLISYAPDLALKLNLKANKDVVEEFFIKVIDETMKMRESQNVTRSDALQLLMEFKKKNNLDVREVVPHAFIFFVAGFENIASILSFALYHLAQNPKYQKRVREEVEDILAKNNHNLSYESLTQMTYVQQVLDETLRLYPPISALTRQCTKVYNLPNTNIMMDSGTRILIPVLGLHMDPDLYPEPNKFDPERFNETNKKSRDPVLYLPFGIGPRNCIAIRFALMKMKLGLASVIKNFEFSVSPKTKTIKLDPTLFVTTAIDTVFLKAKRLH